ncbi:MAG: hypothetical protein ACRC8A_16150 [Microcoleaceae cyanobacterium]
MERGASVADQSVMIDEMFVARSFGQGGQDHSTFTLQARTETRTEL